VCKRLGWFPRSVGWHTPSEPEYVKSLYTLKIAGSLPISNFWCNNQTEIRTIQLF
jgi:hypothetical protein